MSQSWQEDAVFYGIDTSRFHDADGDGNGDLKGVLDKLDYLASLGVTHLWLLPFYPSPRRDNGYDVTDYCAVDERLGTLEDFDELVARAHEKGIRIFIDLVIHHTSDQHHWFEQASSDTASRFHDYYVWDKQPLQEPPSANNFPKDEPAGVWHYVPKLDKYYHHMFYNFQPDLDIANPDVRKEIEEIITFWVQKGADGFRIDGATHLFEQKGSVRSALDAGKYLEELSSYAGKARLLGEANVDMGEIDEYLDDGHLDMKYNFQINNALFLALARESSGPIVERLDDLRSITSPKRLLNFARNFDEINLAYLSDAQRQEVYDVFAPDENMRIYETGIRRQLAPMMKNAAQLEMVYSLLFSLPGVPLITNGSELLIDEDLTKKDRESVRLWMPWDKLGQNKPTLVEFFTELIHMRKKLPILARKFPTAVSGQPDSLLIFDYGDVMAIHNLSVELRKVSLDLNNYQIIFGNMDEDSIDGYGYAWLKKGGDL